MFHTALLPISFREPIEKLQAMTAFLENFDTRRLLLLYVGTSAKTSRPQRRLQHIAEQITREQLEIECLVRQGSPAFETNRTAWEEDAQFIYFPWKHKSFIQRSLVGSTTKDVIRISDLPVFVFKQRPGRSDPSQPFRILYPTNFADTDRYVIPYLQYAGLSADELVLLNVRERAPDPAAEERHRQACKQNLQRLSSELEENYREVTLMERTGNPRRHILRSAKREGIDLIVLGKSDVPESGLSAMLGSTAEEVANESRCSVLIVGRAYEPAQVRMEEHGEE
jgi:nucleotide-binding universal stress UspA family protein